MQSMCILFATVFTFSKFFLVFSQNFSAKMFCMASSCILLMCFLRAIISTEQLLKIELQNLASCMWSEMLNSHGTSAVDALVEDL